MLSTYKISITVNITKGAHDESHEQAQAQWRTLRKLGTAAKDYCLERLYNLLNKYDTYLTEKYKQYMDQFPPHSLVCEKRCCQKSFNSYHRFLKKELRWGADGHIE